MLKSSEADLNPKVGMCQWTVLETTASLLGVYLLGRLVYSSLNALLISSFPNCVPGPIDAIWFIYDVL